MILGDSVESSNDEEFLSESSETEEFPNAMIPDDSEESSNDEGFEVPLYNISSFEKAPDALLSPPGTRIFSALPLRLKLL